MDNASLPTSNATQLKVIEDFLGYTRAPAREQPKPRPTLSDPALLCLMSLWPEERRMVKSSSQTRAVRTTGNAWKKRSTTEPAVDSLRPHPRPRPNPEVKRILSQPTLLGRSTQPCIRQISTSLSSSEDLPLQDKAPVISYPLALPVQGNSAATLGTTPSPLSLDRPIGAKMAELWYAERDRRKRAGTSQEELDQPPSEGAIIVAGLGVKHSTNQSALPSLSRPNHSQPRTPNPNPRHRLTSSVYSQESSSSTSSSSSSSVQTPTADSTFLSPDIIAQEFNDEPERRSDHPPSPGTTHLSTIRPLNITKRSKSSSSSASSPSLPHSERNERPPSPPPTTVAPRHPEALSDAASPSSHHPIEVGVAQGRPQHSLARGGSSRPRPRARSNAEASTSQGTTLPVMSCPPVAATTSSSDKPPLPSPSSATSSSVPSPASASTPSSQTATRPRSRTISFAPLPSKVIVAPPPMPELTPDLLRAPSRPAMQRSPSSSNESSLSIPVPNLDTPPTPAIPALDALTPKRPSNPAQRPSDAHSMAPQISGQHTDDGTLLSTPPTTNSAQRVVAAKPTSLKRPNFSAAWVMA
ncbi:hypothetical protein BKA70DRAFT_1433308 [Coprinopsis sp. MPI-PUGE-AT-0042]|nr:hypothetical protein BKA70DRAFT_1433308 [Coprinopsis sp. MPI-PUGE-AT-0042]